MQTHTSQMVSFQMINAREASLTDRAAKMLLDGLHGGPSGRRSGVMIRKRIKAREEFEGRGGRIGIAPGVRGLVRSGAAKCSEMRGGVRGGGDVRGVSAVLVW